MFGVKTTVWTVDATKTGVWYYGGVESAKRSIVRCHNDEADLRKHRRASVVGGA